MTAEPAISPQGSPQLRNPLLSLAAQPLWMTPAVASSDTWEWEVPIPERTFSCCTCAESQNYSAFASCSYHPLHYLLFIPCPGSSNKCRYMEKHFGKRQSRHSSARHLHRRMLCSSKTKLGQRDLQQLQWLLLGCDGCAPALHRIRINLFVGHFPHHHRSCHRSMHLTFKSTKIILLQTKTGAGLGQVA